MRLIDGDALQRIFSVPIPASADAAREIRIGMRIYQGIAIECVDSAPTVDAEPIRHGAWLGGDADGYADGELVYDTFVCSECSSEYDADDYPLHWAFCPNCGAKMDLRMEGDEDNEAD